MIEMGKLVKYYLLAIRSGSFDFNKTNSIVN